MIKIGIKNINGKWQYKLVLLKSYRTYIYMIFKPKFIYTIKS